MRLSFADQLRLNELRHQCNLAEIEQKARHEREIRQSLASAYNEARQAGVINRLESPERIRQCTCC